MCGAFPTNLFLFVHYICGMLTRVLGAFNGIVIGTILGLGLYVGASGATSVTGVVLAIKDIGGLTVAAAGSGTALSVVKLYPTAPVLAGALSGILGGGLALFLPLGIPLPQQAIGGAVAAAVVGLLVRLLPGL